MSDTLYTPGIGNSPFGNLNTNPQGSFYGLESEYSPAELNLIQKDIKRIIFDAAPAQFDSLKVAFSKPFIDKNLDEFEYLEHSFGRSPLVAAANTAAQAATPGAHVTQTLTITAGSVNYVSPDLIIVYPDGITHGVIASVTGTSIVVNSLTNEGLPAVTTGDVFAIQSTLRSDGMDYFSTYQRTETITRYNYIQFMLRAQRWTSIELQKFINAGTTNYLEVNKAEKLKQLRVDVFNSYWNGKRGEFTMSNGYVAKAMGGVLPTMLAAGSANPSTTLAGLQATFETTAFQTNFKSDGGTRFVYGTDEILNEFSKIYKQPGLRYEPNNELANLKLGMIKLGTMNFVLVPCELWREESCFDSTWARRIIVLDQETVNPVKMRGIPAMNMGQTDDLSKGVNRDYIDYWNTAQFSIEFNNPLASFSMNIL